MGLVPVAGSVAVMVTSSVPDAFACGTWLFSLADFAASEEYALDHMRKN
jgi:hypothetical protein